MTTRRFWLTISIIVAMFALYLLIRPLGSGYTSASSATYTATSIGVSPDNTWSQFSDNKMGELLIQPGEAQPVVTTLTFKDPGAVILRLSALWPSSASPWLLKAGALCWIATMALYVWRFTPMLIRPRAS